MQTELVILLTVAISMFYILLGIGVQNVMKLAVDKSTMCLRVSNSGLCIFLWPICLLALASD